MVIFFLLLLCFARKPNFVLMFADDLGYGDPGFNGNPTTQTPNLDRLAASGAVMTQWYTGAAICSASRAALLTGRQFPRLGVKSVYIQNDAHGLPPNETTLGAYLKKAGYKTAIVGKWHLGQREIYLPGSNGFDEYLGIPFSDDMGEGKYSSCVDEDQKQSCNPLAGTSDPIINYPWLNNIELIDNGTKYIPLLYQKNNVTTVVEQPLDFTFLGEKYYNFSRDFIKRNADNPFFLYLPFSHVHTTRDNLEGMQYSGCMFRGKTERGVFGDALSELDWILGGVVAELEALNLMDDTVIFFTSDNGPWLRQKYSSGSFGTFPGVSSGYWNTGKGSTWEGGVRMPAFVSWRGHISPGQRIPTVVSSLDVVPTILDIAGADPPTKPDGFSFKDVLLNPSSRDTHHEFLFLYWPTEKHRAVSAARWKQYKIHWYTQPGLGGCNEPTCKAQTWDPPLVFDVVQDPAEMWPLNLTKSELLIVTTAYQREKESMVFRPFYQYPGEPPYAVCCDRAPWGEGNGTCDCNGPPACQE